MARSQPPLRWVEQAGRRDRGRRILPGARSRPPACGPHRTEADAAILERAGFSNFAVNAGGDIRLRGGALPGDRWRVGIQHPILRGRVAAVVEATELAVATSGAYARGDHVLDPHTGRAPQGVLSVTITGPDLAIADAYATAAFAMGLRGPSWTAGLQGYEAMTILADGRVLTTAGFPAAPAASLQSATAGD